MAGTRPRRMNLDEASRHAIALVQRGRFAEALAAFDRALEIAPRNAPALNGRAFALMQLGRAEEAAASLAQAVKAEPRDTRARYNLGNVMMTLGRAEEAVAHYDRALALDPGYAFAHGNRGNALRKLGRYREALDSFERMLALAPQEPEAHYNKGVTLGELGRFEEAEACFADAIRLNPRRAKFHLSRINVRPCAAGDPRLAAIEALAEDIGSLPVEDRMQLHFALAKAYRALGEHARSFDHLLQGNALKRRTVAYDPAAVESRFARLREAFTAETMAQKAGLGQPSAVPVFILGMLRSGSTLVEQILASHPQVFGAGELSEFSAAAKGEFAERTGLGYPEAMAHLSGDDLKRIGARYLEALRGRVAASGHAGPEPKRITDKLPGNFAHLGLIHLALPEAKIIHTVRDPVDTCLSCFSILFIEGQHFTYDLGELGRHYRAYEKLMAHWRRVLPEGVMLDVRYEDVVADLEGQARRIVAHCGLEWDDACLAFHKTERPVVTASTTQVRQPIYATSVGRARPYQDRLGPLLEALGRE